MRLKQNSATAIVVQKSWAGLQAIKLFLGDCPSCEIHSEDDGHLIVARVLDDTDPRGLWIELNTTKHANDPSAELNSLMIPWRAVLGIVTAKDLAHAAEEAKQAGLTLTVT
jgi:nitrate reductase NapAB chaperone NapD